MKRAENEKLSFISSTGGRSVLFLCKKIDLTCWNENRNVLSTELKERIAYSDLQQLSSHVRY
jgi:hypothetical protein